MRLRCVYEKDGRECELELDANELVENIVFVLEAELGVDSSTLILINKRTNSPLNLSSTISATDLKDNDQIIASHTQPRPSMPLNLDFSSLFQNSNRVSPRQPNISHPQIDPKILENFQLAYECMPETFAQVHMLYINCKLNNIQMAAFVDSGAAVSIISKALAEKAGIADLIDTRYQGVARGVGEAKIIGRIHMVQLQLGDSYFPLSLNVLEDMSIDLLLGLNFMRTNQAEISLKEHVLKVGNERIPFLSDVEAEKLSTPAFK